MERWVQILILVLAFTACADENACLKNTGVAIENSIDTPAFDQIEIYNGIEVEIIQSEDTVIKITTGENIAPFINLEVAEKTLIIKDDNSCNWLRDYNLTKIKIYHPNLKAIKNLGYNRVFSSDTLYYPSLSLTSVQSTGDFHLIVYNDKISISINDLSNVYLAGKTNLLFAGIYAGDARIEASELIAENIEFFHRGTNDMHLYPVDELKGRIISIGNVIYHSDPENISVEDTGAGALIGN